jgi:hypothetical protein
MNSSALLRLRRALLALTVATSIACGQGIAPIDAGDATIADAPPRTDVAADQGSLEDRPSIDAPDASAADSGSDAPDADATPPIDVAPGSDASAADARTDATTPIDVAPGGDAGRDAAADSSVLDASSDAGFLDAGRDAAADSGALCAIAGDWTTSSPMFGMLQFRFRSDGTWVGAPPGVSLDSGAAIALGNYSTATGTLVLSNEPGLSGCMMGDRGEYRLTYDGTCGTMVWTLVSDTCATRAAALGGATLRRLVADGGAADAGPSDAGACRMIGDWSTMVAGGPLWFRFIADGTWEAALSAMQLASGPRIALGNQSETPPRIVLTNDPSSVSGCAMTDRGEYTITYTPGCGSARWTLVTDTCMVRATSLNGATLTRL